MSYIDMLNLMDTNFLSQTLEQLNLADMSERKKAKIRNTTTMFNTRIRLTNDADTRYRFKNLPDTVCERVLKQALQFTGHVIFFEEGEDIFALRGGYTDMPDRYGEYDKGIVYGQGGYVKDVDLATTLKRDYGNAVYVRENHYNIPFQLYVDEFAYAIADCMLTLETERRLLKHPDIPVYKESMKEAVKAYEKAIDNNEHYIGIQCKLDPSEFDLKARSVSAPDCQAITSLIEWYYNQFYTLAGIKTNAEVDKKANLLYDEVHQYDEAADMHENLLDALEEDIDKVNKRFGLNIEIEKTSERQTGEAEAMKGSTVRYAGSKGGDTL